MAWVKRWKIWMSEKPIRSGIYRLRKGGYYVRIRATQRNGTTSTFSKALPGASLSEATRVQLELRENARAPRSRSKKRLFADYAVSLLEHKIAKGDLKSPKSVERWSDTLPHLIEEFGAIPCVELHHADIDQWKAKLGKLLVKKPPAAMKTKKDFMLSPRTANGWLSILRVITKAMTIELDLARDPSVGISFFDLDDRPTYTDEKPNSLSPQKAGEFLEGIRLEFVQHYAFTVLGMVTGWRPSSMRPIRKAEDLNLEEGSILIRRSHTLGQTVMEKTKTGKRQKVWLPRVVVEILRQHIALLEHPPLLPSGKPPLWWRKEMASSPLLFPSRDGGYRSPSCLDKPFAAVSKAIGVSITPRGMRRTFQDLARATGVHDVVTRSISGHATEQMHHHYSTASQLEQRAGIAGIANLVHTSGVESGGAKEKGSSVVH